MARLSELRSKVDIGLHLCLTDECLPLAECGAWPGGRPPQLGSFRNLGFDGSHLIALEWRHPKRLRKRKPLRKGMATFEAQRRRGHHEP
jgi:hypothetical protein